MLFDREGWFAALQARAGQPYPDELARAIMALNVPLLHGAINTRPAQTLRAAQRGDLVGVSMALTRLLDSYFDVLFALNRVPHPGEKRLLKLVAALSLLPDGFPGTVERLLSFTLQTLGDVPRHVDAVVTPLLELLETRGELPPIWGERG